MVLFTAASIKIMMTNEIYTNKYIKHVYIISIGIILNYLYEHFIISIFHYIFVLKWHEQCYNVFAIVNEIDPSRNMHFSRKCIAVYVVLQILS